MLSMDEWVRLVLIGVGATAVMDLWSVILKRLGIPTLDYAMVGRWAGHLCRGQFAHASIGKAAPVRSERSLGWAIHYAVGIVFAALLVGVYGVKWLHDPEWLPAVIVGTVTVVFPYFVMQPAMGAGIAASRTPTPWRNRLRSLLAHGIFGGGLYLSATLLNQVCK
ncbi:DUF2938 domain-containing protein [Pseudomonas costantinii]|uniref:DUF2938 domain-containing protein n=1 Tax=Pseudomonas costantinii TaxID=168469 RepID=A0A1S2UGT7_9PSED|nr:DUF2938 domain-containing protein [Pseudomonas costantinii]NVZ18648.1 DUF2938 domain-containing protein [Pseudomonas costantinii]OIN45651.1 hypothetical protein BFL40_28980 [Pseudomonas costantinii]SED44754.1 Protein of unknown function [Pseudomonas costantinii]